MDHKIIGTRYMLTAFVFFSLAGIEALLFHTKLAIPENKFPSPEAYNLFFTMHGTAMVFFFAAPILFGFGGFLIPLLLGSRGMAFPRLHAFSYWCFLLSGLFMVASPFFSMAPDGGLFSNYPLTSRQYSPGLHPDFWSLGLIQLSIASTAGAINFIVSISKMRAPGMSLSRMPLFCWSILVTSFTVIFAIPALTTVSFLMAIQGMFGFHFFDALAGGGPLLQQNLFWVFGYADVYLLLPPAIGIVSEIVTTFSGKRVLGYTLIVVSTVALGIVSLVAWVSPMLPVRLSPLVLFFFSISSIFMGAQIFAWLGIMVTGRPRLKTPLLFSAGFLFLVVVGGLTGVIILIFVDRQVTDTSFIVAYFPYILLGVALFPILGAFHYWFPKITGRMLNERAGVWNFWLMFAGFNLTFYSMPIDGPGWNGLNMFETSGAFIFGLGILIFALNAAYSWRAGEEAGENPWGGSSLEWATASPPPPYNFEILPEVHSRDPLWEAGNTASNADRQPGPVSMAEDPTYPADRETLSTSLIEARPESILRMPEDSLLPFWLSLSISLAFVGLLVGQYWLALLGAILSTGLTTTWLWPPQAQRREELK